jgi:uncharacterized membrane protein HdeD (DUF308 family)
MLMEVARDWWVLVLHGVLAVLFGLGAIALPGLTLLLLIVVFGVFVIADGVTALVGLFRRHPYAPRWALALHAVLGIGAGVVALLWPQITGVALLYLIAAWAIAIGALRMVAAISLRRVIEHEWFLALSGILSIAFGIIAVARPLTGALALAWLIGVYAILFGVSLIALGIRLHGLRKRVAPA